MTTSSRESGTVNAGLTILVCGDRNFTDVDWLYGALDAINRDGNVIRLVSGHARGADQLAEMWAHERGIETEVYIAAWDIHGNAAGPIRNQEMLDAGKPDLVIAFPGGKGTRDMVRRARDTNIPVQQPPKLMAPNEEAQHNEDAVVHHGIPRTRKGDS